jgi:HK97 family phage portal protein
MWPFSTFKRSLENPSVSLNNPAAWLNLFGKSPSGQVVNQETAMAISAVWACWRILAETVASLQWQVEQIDGKNINIDKAHPVAKLINNPSELYTSFGYREALMLNMLAHGVGYAEVIRNGSGIPLELVVIPSNEVTPVQDNRKLYYKIANRDKPVKAINMIAVPVMSFNGVDTNSVVMKARDLLGEMLSAQQLAGDFYANGAMLSGVITTDSDLTPDQRNALQKSWDAKHAGRGNSGKTALLSNGLKYMPISSDLEGAQLLEMRTFYNQEVARMYNVPQHMIGELSRSTNNNIEQQSLDFAKYTIRPYLKRLEEEEKRKLLSVDDTRRTRYNIDSLLRADIESRGAFYQVMRMIGGFSQNDVRRLENMNPVEGGDDYTPMMLAQTNPNGEGNEDI